MFQGVESGEAWRSAALDGTFHLRKQPQQFQNQSTVSETEKGRQVS